MDFEDGFSIKYSVLIWNDEKHSFSDLISILENAFGYSKEKGYECALRVDTTGRDVVETSDNLEFLVQSLSLISATSIKASIAPTKIVFREYMATYLLTWLCDLIKMPTDFGNVAKQVIAKELRTEVISEMKSNLDFSNQGRSNSSKRLRIDMLLTLSHEMWKLPSKLVIRIIISTLIMNGDDLKKWVGSRFAVLYLKIAKEYCQDEKSFDLTILSLSVQLFNSPIVTKYLLQTTNLFHDCLLVLKASMYQLFDTRINLRTDFEQSIAIVKQTILPIYPRSTQPLELYSTIKYDDFLCNLNYLIVSWKRSLEFDIFDIRSGNRDRLQEFLDFLTVLQACNQQKRAVVSHIEFDTNEWIFYFTFMEKLVHTIIFPIVELYSAPGNEVSNEVIYLISETVDKLLTWTLHDHWGSLANKGSMDRIQSRSSTGFHFRGLSDVKYYIPNRSISVQPVSFIHPLHWFLAALLIKIPVLMDGKSKIDLAEHLSNEIFLIDEKRISDANQKKATSVSDLGLHLASVDRLLLIFDYPMEALALTSQVRAGLWVRNGSQIRNQAIEFKDRSLRECYDLNFYLVQYAFTIFDQNLILTALLDKFGILEWFSPNYTSFESEKLLFVAQDFLHLLICLVTERNVLNAETAEQTLKAEVIHHLVSNPKGIAYSKLFDKLKPLARLGGSYESRNSLIDAILLEVAEFTAPTSYSATGIYTLKPKYLDSVNHWFWHFDRNQRAETEDMLKNSSSNWPKHIAPMITKLKEKGGFSKINRIVTTRVYAEILLFGFCKVCIPFFEPESGALFSEDLFDHLLQLLITGIAVVENTLPLDERLFRNMIDVNIESALNGSTVSLLEILVQLESFKNTSELKPFTGRLFHIREKLMQLGPEEMKKRLLKQELVAGGVLEQQIHDAEIAAKKDTQKIANAARKMAILAQFTAAQSSFIDNYEEDLLAIDLEQGKDFTEGEHQSSAANHEHSEWKYPSGNCIICQEDVLTGTHPYGLLAFLQNSKIRRLFDFSNEDQIKSIYEFNMNSRGKDYNSSPFFNNSMAKNVVVSDGNLLASTCGHLMHFQCHDDYRYSILKKHAEDQYRAHPENIALKEYFCPLCKTLGNSLLPVCWSTKREQSLTISSLISGLDDRSYFEYFARSFKYSVSDLIVEVENQAIKLAVPQSRFMDRIHRTLDSPIGDNPTGVISLSEYFDYYVFEIFGLIKKWPDLESCHDDIKLVLQSWDLLISTLCSVEIFYRDTDLNILNCMTSQTQGLVRILAQISSIAVLSKFAGKQSPFSYLVLQYLQELIPCLSRKTGPSSVSPLMSFDGFSNLVRIGLCIVPQLKGHPQNTNILMWVRFFAHFEFFRSIVSSLEAAILYQDWPRKLNPLIELRFDEEELVAMRTAIQIISQQLGLSTIMECLQTEFATKLLLQFCSAVLLCYNRRCIIFLYAHFGLIVGDEKASGSELDRTLKNLRLPSVLNLLQSLVASEMSELLNHWAKSITERDSSYWDSLRNICFEKTSKITIFQKVLIEQPQVQNLVHLPREMNTLIDWALSSRCQRCNQSILDSISTTGSSFMSNLRRSYLQSVCLLHRGWERRMQHSYAEVFSFLVDAEEILDCSLIFGNAHCFFSLDH